MTRVVHCVGDLAPQSGGTSRVVRDLTDALSAADRVSKVVLLTQHRPGSRMIDTQPGSRVDQRLGCSESDLSLKAGWPLRKLLNTVVGQARPDLLHDHGIWLPSNHHVAVAARRLDIPLVIHPHGMLESWALKHRGWKKRLALQMYQHRDLQTAALFIASAELEAESIRRLGLLQPIAVIPNGVEVATPRSTGNGHHGPRTALFLSRIHPKKGLLNLIEAWGQLRPDGWRLCLAGPDEGGHLAEVMRLVRARSLDSVIKYVGVVEGDAKDALYKNADLFVLPSFSENFGVVVAEALSHGMPVITTRGTPWEGLLHHGCGWWIDPTVDALSETLRQALVMDSVSLRAMGDKGREYSKEFNWPNIALQTVDVYQWLLGQGSKPACVNCD